MKPQRFFMATITFLIINAFMCLFLMGLFREYDLHYIGYAFGVGTGFVGRKWIQDIYDIGMK